MPAPPAKLVARIIARQAASTWSGERLHVLDERGEGAAFNPTTMTWTDEALGVAPKPMEPALDVNHGAGPLEPAATTGNEHASRGAELQPKPWKGAFTYYDGFDGASLRFDGGPPITLPRENAPAPRGMYLFARVKDGVVIWGGQTEAGLTDTGAIYDRTTGVWRPTASANAPAPRRAPATLTWTGSRLVVFGSHYVNEPHPDGALLDPTTGAWTPLATGGPAVTAQEGLGRPIIWSGKRLVFIGTTKPGAALDPATNAWTALPATPKLEETYLVRAWSAPNGDVVLARLAPTHATQSNMTLYAATLDPTTGTLHELPPAPLAATQEQVVHFNGNTLLVWGGSTEKMVNPGGGCTGQYTPCDPVGPMYETKERAEGALIRLY
jgi:hypothetical protein